MIQILSQGPRLHVEAAKRTSDVNEAYMMVHTALARAMQRSAVSTKLHASRSALANTLANFVTAALERPIAAGEIAHRVAH